MLYNFPGSMQKKVNIVDLFNNWIHSPLLLEGENVICAAAPLPQVPDEVINMGNVLIPVNPINYDTNLGYLWEFWFKFIVTGEVVHNKTLMVICFFYAIDTVNNCHILTVGKCLSSVAR